MAYTVDLRKKSEPKPEKISEPVRPIEEPVPAHTSLGAISWTTSLSRPPAKKAAFTVAAVMGIGAVATLYFGHDILFALVLALIGVIFVVVSYREPSRDEIELDSVSLTVSGKRYLFTEFKSFWIDYRPPYIKELSLEFKKLYAPMLRIPLENADPLKIRAIMVSLVTEKEHQESILDQVIRRLNG